MTNQPPATEPTPTARTRRPELDAWLRSERVSFRRFGSQIGRSHEYVRRLCLPFGDAGRTVPDEHTAGLIFQATGREIAPPSFTDPATQGEGAAE